MNPGGTTVSKFIVPGIALCDARDFRFCAEEFLYKA